MDDQKSLSDGCLYGMAASLNLVDPCPRCTLTRGRARAIEPPYSRPYAKAELSSVVDDSQRDRVVITRHGRPAAIIIGVEGSDFDDLMLSLDEDLWRTMIERRQRNPRGIPFDQVRRQRQVGERSGR